MLVLTRKQQDTIQIGEEIVVTVVKIKGNVVRLGIDAPREIRVVRGEVEQRDRALKSTAIEFELDLSDGEDPSAGESVHAACRSEHGPYVAV
jgi:carbon storage regulator CsrA